MAQRDQRWLSLGEMFQQATTKHGATPIRLDRPLDISPEDGVHTTVGRIGRLVEETAARLHHAGVRPGQTVAVFKSQNADLVVLTCAIVRLGSVAAPIAPGTPASTTLEMLEQIRPTHLVLDGAHWTVLAPLAQRIRALVDHLVTVGDAIPGLARLAEHACAPTPPVRPLDQGAPVIITHTSGTTGQPKMVLQTTGSLAAAARFQLRIARLLGIRERYALCVSFVHGRPYSLIAAGLRRGMSFALMADQELESARAVLADFRPGAIETHPNTFINWEVLAEDPGRPLAHVKYFISTFDAIHPRTVRCLLAASRRRMPVYLQGYGQTETGPVTIRPYTRRGAQRADGRCVGYPIPGLTRIRIKGARGVPSPIWARTPGLAVTYVGQDARFEHQLDGGWLNMGDLGFRGRWGCVHLLDREVEHCEGVQSTLAIEDVVMERLVDCTEVLVVPLASGELQPVVCTREDRPLDLDAWRSVVSGQLPMAAPLHCRWHELPRTSTAKVRRLELRRQLDGGWQPAALARAPAGRALTPPPTNDERATSDVAD